jgi:hypothetical protein
MMKHVKHITEGWFDKILPTKSLSEELKEVSEMIIISHLQNLSGISDIKIDISDNNQSNCYIKIYSEQEDEFGDNECYTFLIKTHDEIITLKAVGYTGLNLAEFKSFKEISYPLHSREDIEEIIELFAIKLEPFVKYMLKIDKVH